MNNVNYVFYKDSDYKITNNNKYISNIKITSDLNPFYLFSNKYDVNVIIKTVENKNFIIKDSITLTGIIDGYDVSLNGVIQELLIKNNNINIKTENLDLSLSYVASDNNINMYIESPKVVISTGINKILIKNLMLDSNVIGYKINDNDLDFYAQEIKINGNVLKATKIQTKNIDFITNQSIQIKIKDILINNEQYKKINCKPTINFEQKVIENNDCNIFDFNLLLN